MNIKHQNSIKKLLELFYYQLLELYIILSSRRDKLLKIDLLLCLFVMIYIYSQLNDHSVFLRRIFERSQDYVFFYSEFQPILILKS